MGPATQCFKTARVSLQDIEAGPAPVKDRNESTKTTRTTPRESILGRSSVTAKRRQALGNHVSFRDDPGQGNPNFQPSIAPSFFEWITPALDATEQGIMGWGTQKGRLLSITSHQVVSIDMKEREDRLIPAIKLLRLVSGKAFAATAGIPLANLLRRPAAADIQTILNRVCSVSASTIEGAVSVLSNLIS